MNKFFITLAAIIATSVGAGSFYYLSKLPPPEHALYYQQAREIKAFEFSDQQGKAFTKAQLADKWSLVFFGYTSCPDVCPTTLQNLSFVYEQLKAIAENSQVLLVTVDPKRDSQEKLAKYIAYFNSEFKALRADHGVLFPFSRNLGLMYAISASDKTEADSNDYLVDHSASLVLINPDGKIAAIFRPEQEIGQIPTLDTAKLVADYEKIVALY